MMNICCKEILLGPAEILWEFTDPVETPTQCRMIIQIKIRAKVFRVFIDIEYKKTIFLILYCREAFI